MLGRVICPASEEREKREESLPGPWGLPLIGYLPWLDQERIFESFAQLRSRYGDIFQIQMGSWPVVVINGREMLKECLLRNSEAFAGRPEFFSFEGFARGSSLAFQTYNPQWKLHHMLVGKALGEMMRSTENSIETLMNRTIARVVQSVATKKSRVFDPADTLYSLAFDIACTMCFGENSMMDEDKLCKQMITTLLDIFKTRKDIQGADIMPWTQCLQRKKMVAFREKQARFERLVTEKILQLQGNQSHKNEMQNALRALTIIGERYKKDREEVGLSLYRLLQSVQDIIGAGADTVGVLPRWVFLYMVHFPAVQAKMQKELDMVLSNGRRGLGRQATAEDIPNLPYTQAVIHEVARHAAIVPLSLPRKVIKDVNIKGFRVKKGSIAFANYHSAARDPALWGDADVFRPERFMTDDGKLDIKATQQWPMFGYGKRRCIGEKFGRLETFLIVAAFMRRFRVRECPAKPAPSVDDGFVNISLEPQPFSVILDDRLTRNSRSG